MRSTWSPQRYWSASPGIGDLHLAQHLADDDLDVLVVDFHALDAIDGLHFVDQVLLEFLGAAGFEQIFRRHGAFGDLVAAFHDVAIGDDDVLAHRDQVVDLLAGFGVGDDDAASCRGRCRRRRRRLRSWR